jgi:hypothetical protein
MVELIRHMLGICGEPHPSLLTLISSIPFIGYYIDKIRKQNK